MTFDSSFDPEKNGLWTDQQWGDDPIIAYPSGSTDEEFRRRIRSISGATESPEAVKLPDGIDFPFGQYADTPLNQIPVSLGSTSSPTTSVSQEKYAPPDSEESVNSPQPASTPGAYTPDSPRTPSSTPFLRTFEQDDEDYMTWRKLPPEKKEPAKTTPSTSAASKASLTSSQRADLDTYTPPSQSTSVLDSTYATPRKMAPSTAVTAMPPAYYAMDKTLSRPDFAFNQYIDPKKRPVDPENPAGLLDIASNMYRAQRAGSSAAPFQTIPAEEKQIIGRAVAALARGKADDPTQPVPEWALDVLYNAGRMAWQADRGNLNNDAKFADPLWVRDWVNSFLQGSTSMTMQARFADEIRKTGSPAPRDLRVAQAGPAWIAKNGRDIVATTMTEPQTAETLQKYGIDPAYTYEVCGPIAASAMLKAGTGDNKFTFGAVFEAAKTLGYWGDIGDGNGWRGPQKMAEFLKFYGVGAEAIDRADDPATMRTLVHDVSQGKPVSITNGTHYFVATDYNPKTGKFFVGTTGEALRRGSAWMSATEMHSLGDGRFTAIRLLEDPRLPQAPVKAQTADSGLLENIDYASHEARNGTKEGEIEAYARRAAEERGLDPDFVIWLINNEGGTTNPVKQNNAGAPAFGPLQLHTAGVGASFKNYMRETYGINADVRDPRWWKAALEFGLETASKARHWKPWEAATQRNREMEGFISPRNIGISDEALAYGGYNRGALSNRRS